MYICGLKLYFLTMRKDHLLAPFELVLNSLLDECPRGLHAHHFFELVYIVTGSGIQYINQVRIEYNSGHLFLLAPGDEHAFEFTSPTQFFFIRFNGTYLQSQGRKNELLQRLEMILKNVGNDPGCILRNFGDQQVIRSLMEAIVREHQHKDLYHQELIGQYISTLLLLIARNISLYMPEKIDENADQKVVEVLEYIQTNICNPDKLRIEQISKQFGISESYLGRYFKKHTDESFQQYIMNYKLKLIENRLLHSNKRINEIADEFGFTDKSHLSRTFKKYRGINPSAFKKQYRSGPLSEV